MQLFYRDQYHTLVLTLTSNEILGVLDSGYLEDYFGTDGQVTLHHLTSDVRTSMLMGESTNESAPHEVFVGSTGLDMLPDGDYQIEGRVRDTAGNYTILSAVSAPRGDERAIELAFAVIERRVSDVLVRLPLRSPALVTLRHGVERVILQGQPRTIVKLPAATRRFTLRPSEREVIL